MSTFLTEAIPVALSGSLGTVGNFNLFASTQPNVVLYVTKRPQLIRDPNGRYAVAVTSYTQQQPDRSMKITGGSAMFSITSAVELDQQSIDEAKQRIASLGIADPNRVRFLPLTVQKGEAQVLMNPVSGKPNEAHNNKDVGIPGGTLSFLLELSELGAQEWAQAIKNRTAIPAGVKFQYEFLRMLPECGAEVKVWGRRVFEHLSAALNVSYNGFFCGGSAQLEAAWDDMKRNGDVEITFINKAGLPPNDQKLLEEMTNSFANQAREMLFSQIFAPMPEVAPAQAGDSGGIFGGANFAMKWKKQTDTIDLSQRIMFKGMTWLKASMDVDFMSLFANLDPSYVTEVVAQQAFDSSLVVDADPMVANVAVSMSYSAGHSPEAPVFGKDGGNQRYTVYSQTPNDVAVTCDAKIDYAPPRWPVIPFKMRKTVGEGGNQMVIKTSQWVGRHEIYMFVREGNRILPPTELSEEDYLVLNVSYAGPHLGNTPVRDSAHLSGLSMVEFSYPKDTQDRPGVAKFSAFGVIGGQMVRAPEQVIPQEDTAVFILATRGGDIQLVTSQTVLGEADRLAGDLVQMHRDRQRSQQETRRRSRAGGMRAETDRRTAGTGNGNGTLGNLATIRGRTIRVEYGPRGTALWLRLTDGSEKRVRLHEADAGLRFERDSRHVQVEMDNAGEYAEAISVIVEGGY